MSKNALIEGAVNCRLAFTGRRANQQINNKSDTTIMNIAVRKVVGTIISAATGIQYALADIKTTHKHHILKTANLLDRVFRATNTAAQGAARCPMDSLHEEERKMGRGTFLQALSELHFQPETKRDRAAELLCFEGKPQACRKLAGKSTREFGSTYHPSRNKAASSMDMWPLRSCWAMSLN